MMTRHPIMSDLSRMSCAEEMTLSRTSSTITFAAPFRLKGVELPQAAGTYKLDTDGEVVEGEYRPVATHLHLRLGGSIRIRAVDPKDLRAAWEIDRTGSPETSIARQAYLMAEGEVS